MVLDLLEFLFIGNEMRFAMSLFGKKKKEKKYRYAAKKGRRVKSAKKEEKSKCRSANWSEEI